MFEAKNKLALASLTSAFEEIQSQVLVYHGTLEKEFVRGVGRLVNYDSSEMAVDPNLYSPLFMIIQKEELPDVEASELEANPNLEFKPPTKGHKHYSFRKYRMDSEVTKEAIVDFVSRMATGDLANVIQSENTESFQRSPHILGLNVDTFDKVLNRATGETEASSQENADPQQQMLGNHTNFLIMFTRTHSRLCEEYFQIYRQTATFYEVVQDPDKRLLFTSVDLSLNEISHSRLHAALRRLAGTENLGLDLTEVPVTLLLAHRQAFVLTASYGLSIKGLDNWISETMKKAKLRNTSTGQPQRRKETVAERRQHKQRVDKETKERIERENAVVAGLQNRNPRVEEDAETLKLEREFSLQFERDDL